MTDYFKKLISDIDKHIDIHMTKNIIEIDEQYSFQILKYGISQEIRYLYNHYKKFDLKWEISNTNMRGFVEFVPYEKLENEHDILNETVDDFEGNFEEQDWVIEDLKHWFPIFKFPNGDAFCYDKRDGKIVFYEHEVFDSGINLHGLLIANSIDDLVEKWSKVLFIDVYDWYEGVDEQGIDLSKPVYKSILNYS